MKISKFAPGTGESERFPDNQTARHAEVAAWELIEAGRYMPRRTRGSFRGRELG